MKQLLLLAIIVTLSLHSTAQTVNAATLNVFKSFKLRGTTVTDLQTDTNFISQFKLPTSAAVRGFVEGRLAGVGGGGGNAIPTTGTTFGNGISGDLEIKNSTVYNNGFKFYTNDNAAQKFRRLLFSNDDRLILHNSNNSLQQSSEIDLGNGETLLSNYGNNDGGFATFKSNGILLNYAGVSSRGISSLYDHSLNISDYDYTQKKYVDDNFALKENTLYQRFKNGGSIDFDIFSSTSVAAISEDYNIAAELTYNLVEGGVLNLSAIGGSKGSALISGQTTFGFPTFRFPNKPTGQHTLATVEDLTPLQSKWTLSGNNLYNNNTGNVGIGTTTPHASAIFDVKSTTKGSFPAPLNDLRFASTNIPNAIKGLHAIDSASGRLMTFDGTNWNMYNNYIAPRTSIVLEVSNFGESTYDIRASTLYTLSNNLSSNTIINTNFITIDGDVFEVFNEEPTFTVTFSGLPVYQLNGTTAINTIPAGAHYIFKRLNGKIRKIN